MEWPLCARNQCLQKHNISVSVNLVDRTGNCQGAHNAPASNEAFSFRLSSDITWSISNSAIVNGFCQFALGTARSQEQTTKYLVHRRLKIDENEEEMRGSFHFIYRSYGI